MLNRTGTLAQILTPPGYKQPIEYLQYLVRCCKALDPKWNPKWKDGTSILQAVSVCSEFIQSQNDRLLPGGSYLHIREDHGFMHNINTIRSGLHSKMEVIAHREPELAVDVQLQFMLDIKRIDRKLHDILMYAIGHFIHHFHIQTFDDYAIHVLEWIDARREDDVENFNGIVQEIVSRRGCSIAEAIKEAEEEYENPDSVTKDIEADMDYFTEGPPSNYVRWIDNPKSLVAIRKLVRSYRWNTFQKRRVLALLRRMDRLIVSGDRNWLKKFNANYGSHPADYMIFRWGETKLNIIEQEADESFHSMWGEGLSPFMVSDSIPLDQLDMAALIKQMAKPSTAASIYDIMVTMCRLFNWQYSERGPYNFIKIYERNRKRQKRLRAKAADQRLPKRRPGSGRSGVLPRNAQRPHRKR